MRTAFILLALAVAGTLADGFGSNHRHSRRQGRRFNNVRNRAGRNRAFNRRGRTEELAAEPLGAYGAADTTAAPEILPPPADYPDYGAEYPDYGAEAAPAPASYGAADAGALDVYAAGDEAAADPNLAMLEKAVPGIPGEDYPIYSEVPESGFTCDGQVDGGYYADPEAECQVFHICTADGQGGLAKYSFLCPNGTVFNQNYFICDWWFNFDCAEAEGLYSLNDDIAAERDALAGGNDEAQSSYGAPEEAPQDSYDYGAEAAADYSYDDYAAEATEAPLASNYGAPGGEDAALADAVLPTEVPLNTYEAEESREARRRFRGRGGRSRNGRRNNGRRNNRRGGQRRGRNQRQGRRGFRG